MKWAISIWNDLLRLFYPRTCLICGRLLLAAEEQCCVNCLADLPRTYYHQYPENPILRLYSGYTQIVGAAAFMYFEAGGQAQKLIHSFKYHGNNQLAEFLGKIAAKNMKKDGVFCEADYFVPVPLHPRKKRQRGYNQAEWIAQGLAEVYQKAVCADVLHRCVYADSQTKKSIVERQQNVENAFEVKDGKRLEGKHVVLVDDVITSGSTTNACLQALLTIPMIKVSIFSIGIVPVRQSTDDFDPMEDAPPDDTEIIVL